MIHPNHCKFWIVTEFKTISRKVLNVILKSYLITHFVFPETGFSQNRPWVPWHYGHVMVLFILGPLSSPPVLLFSCPPRALFLFRRERCTYTLRSHCTLLCYSCSVCIYIAACRSFVGWLNKNHSGSRGNVLRYCKNDKLELKTYLLHEKNSRWMYLCRIWKQI